MGADQVLYSTIHWQLSTRAIGYCTLWYCSSRKYTVELKFGLGCFHGFCELFVWDIQATEIQWSEWIDQKFEGKIFYRLLDDQLIILVTHCHFHAGRKSTSHKASRSLLQHIRRSVWHQGLYCSSHWRTNPGQERERKGWNGYLPGLVLGTRD